MTANNFKRHCHTGPMHVMTIGRCRIFAAGLQEVAGDYDWDLMIRLFDGEIVTDDKNTTVTMNDAAKATLPEAMTTKAKLPPIIDVVWPDFYVPALPKAWWQALNQWLRSQKTDKDVVIFCLGGHGRTGTALSILAGLNPKIIGKKDPVSWVRDHYCKNIVESQGQMNYITQITGCEIPNTVRPAFAYVLGWDDKESDVKRLQAQGAKPVGSGPASANEQAILEVLKSGAGAIDVPPEQDWEWEDEDEPADADDGSWSGSHHRMPL